MEDYVKDIEKRNIGHFLNNLENDFKIKHIKNLYQIYNMLFHTIKVINRNQDFSNLNTSINNFYSYLTFTTISLKEEIYSFIRLIYEEELI